MKLNKSFDSTEIVSYAMILMNLWYYLKHKKSMSNKNVTNERGRAVMNLQNHYSNTYNYF